MSRAGHVDRAARDGGDRRSDWEQQVVGHRESRGSSAEIDYVIQRNEEIIPIEVKAGSAGKMRSLHLFLKERNAPRGIRVSLENYSRYGKIETHPLYAIWCLK